MRVASEEKVYHLSPQAIDECSERLDEALVRMDIEQRNRIRGRLLMENALIELLAHYGEGFPVTIQTGMRLNSFYMRVVYHGEPYNPLVKQGEARNWHSTLLSTTGASPTYGCSGNKNSLQMVFGSVLLNPAAALFISICAGILFGILGSLLLPDALQSEITGVVLSPLLNVLGSILNVLAAPVVCLMVLTTMLNARAIEFSGGSRHHVAIRYFSMSVLLSCVAVFFSLTVFRVHVDPDTLDLGFLEMLVMGIEESIPDNIIVPFTTSNTPQLLAICFVVANAIIFLGDSTTRLTELIHEANMVGTLITNWVGNLVPMFVTMLLALEIWNGSTYRLISMWKPLVFSVVITLFVMLVTYIHVGIQYKVGILKLVRKTWKAFKLTVSTGTLDTSYGEAEYSCVRQLGMAKEYTDVVLPQGLVLYMPASFMGTLAFILFCAQNEGVTITVSWLVAAVVLDVLLFVATPAVPGANLLAFISIFATLGISRTAFLDAMIFDIIFGIFANAANQTLLQMEMIKQARRIGMLNEDILRR